MGVKTEEKIRTGVLGHTGTSGGAPIAEPAGVEVECLGDTAIVKPSDRLDLIGYVHLEERLYALAVSGISRFVLDLSEVTLLSSTCAAALMRFWADLHVHRGKLIIARPTAGASACIRACGLDELMEVSPTQREALKAVRWPEGEP